MKFAIYKTSTDECVGIRNFNTVEELMKFRQCNKNDIIITINLLYNEDVNAVKEWNPKVSADELVAIPYAIEIYDDYRE